MNIIIGSDVVPTNSNITDFKEGNIKGLLGEDLNEIWNKASLRIFNLEVPLSDKETPISKCGPNFIAPRSTIKGIKSLNPSLVTLANNHILDQGKEGLISTTNLLRDEGIPFLGVGKSLNDASKPFIFNVDNKKIGVYACVENEFSIATESTAGANPYDPLNTFDHIGELKDNSDYVIVLYHGGKEHYRFPSPNLQKVCRKMVEKGADLVICQHSHCIGSYENYKGSSIIYGQGNFIFDKTSNEYRNTSLLIDIEFSEKINLDFIPVVKSGHSIRLAKGTKAEQILQDFASRSEEILVDGFIEKKYREFAEINIENYLRKISGSGKWISRIDRIILNNYFLKKKYNKEKLLAINNFIECEAHRELILEGLKRSIEKI